MNELYVSNLFAIVGGLLTTLLTFLFIRSFFKNKNLKEQLDISVGATGLKITSKEVKKLKPLQITTTIQEIVTFVENAREAYVDDVIGIKNRFFKQSKDYAKSALETVKNEIIEEYKILYMYTYDGKAEETSKKLKDETDAHLRKTNVPPTIIQVNNKSMMINPCSNICNKGCNSGLNFFESRLTKDFKFVLESVYTIVEENHLINRPDREYEEEIISKANQLTSYLRNVVISYPIPIDNEIAKRVLDDKAASLKEAIADSLRRSRTLSASKRDEINNRKAQYIKLRNTQLSQTLTILDDKDMEKLFKNSDTILNNTI